jgi:hypothetical protein
MRGRHVTMVLAGAMGLVMVGSAGAQQARRGVRDGSGPQVDVTQVTTFSGSVVGFLAGAGMGTPQLTVDVAGTPSTFVLGPYPYLLEQGFVAEPGDQVTVTAFACASCPSGLAVARVENTTRNLTVVLRGDNGLPLWIGGGAGRDGTPRRVLRPRSGPGMGGGGQAMGTAKRGTVGHGRLCGGVGPDMTRATTFSGTVASFVGGPGEGLPVLTLATASGPVEIMASPYHAIAHAGYTFEEGRQLTVAAAPVDLDGEDHWVAISITDASTGLVIQLRDAESGLPLHRRGHGF